MPTVDFVAILKSIDHAMYLLNNLRTAVAQYRRSFMKVGSATVAMTTDQKASLLKAYSNIRDQLFTEFQNLPKI